MSNFVSHVSIKLSKRQLLYFTAPGFLLRQIFDSVARVPKFYCFPQQMQTGACLNFPYGLAATCVGLYREDIHLMPGQRSFCHGRYFAYT